MLTTIIDGVTMVIRELSQVMSSLILTSDDNNILWRYINRMEDDIGRLLRTIKSSDDRRSNHIVILKHRDTITRIVLFEDNSVILMLRYRENRGVVSLEGTYHLSYDNQEDVKIYIVGYHYTKITRRDDRITISEDGDVIIDSHDDFLNVTSTEQIDRMRTAYDLSIDD